MQQIISIHVTENNQLFMNLHKHVSLVSFIDYQEEATTKEFKTT